LAVACSGDSNSEAPTATPPAEATTSTSPTVTAPAATATLPPAPDPAAIMWTACGSFQCGKLSVPLNYADPNGQQIELAMIRLPARSGALRIGSLLVNFGGPGGSGVDYLPGFQGTVPSEIRDRFDLVSFDPRGVGQSAPIACNDNIQQVLGLDPTPDSPEEWTEVDQVSKDLADLCAQRNAELLPYMGTVNVARDLDQMRKALGDAKLTYLGYSYGTTLGITYGEMFPQNVRALVLDGVVDTSLSGDDIALGQALGFEGAMNDYVAYCAARRCIAAYPDDPMAGITELTNQAEAAPIPAPGADRAAGPGEVYNALSGAMYTEVYYPLLTRAINAGLSGNGTQLVDLADLLWQRNSDGSYPNLFEVLYAVNCLDYEFNRDPEYYRGLADQFEAKAPYYGTALVEGEIPCAYWGPRPTPLPKPTGKDLPPVLVIGTTRDPATPYDWAVSLSEKLPSSVLLTFQGVGHTAYLRSGSCITDPVDDYFINLTLPPAGTICGDPQYATPIDLSP
jgi:pimeloyl-ACP methyl ester carboxylesterase